MVSLPTAADGPSRVLTETGGAPPLLSSGPLLPAGEGLVNLRGAKYRRKGLCGPLPSRPLIESRCRYRCRLNYMQAPGGF